MSSKIASNVDQSLVNQYREIIYAAVIESEEDFKTRMDLGKLNSKFKVIMKAAAYDGLPESTVSALIDEAMAPSVYQSAA